MKALMATTDRRTTVHDPLVVAFTIRSPLPRRTGHSLKPGKRWSRSGPFATVAGRGVYFPSLVTIWHREPGGRDSGEVCKHWKGPKGARVVDNRWRWHVHHWRVQVSLLQDLRRRLLTRCAWCGGRSRRRDAVNVSHQWDGPRGKWWQGEPGLFHHDCSPVQRAHATCTCDNPLPADSVWNKGPGWHGKCALCDRFRPGLERDPREIEAVRVYQVLAKGERPSVELRAYVKELYAEVRAERAATEA